MADVPRTRNITTAKGQFDVIGNWHDPLRREGETEDHSIVLWAPTREPTRVLRATVPLICDIADVCASERNLRASPIDEIRANRLRANL